MCLTVQRAATIVPWRRIRSIVCQDTRPWSAITPFAASRQKVRLATRRCVATMKAVPNGCKNPIIVLGRTHFRNQHKIFGIWQADRRAHMYIIGKTGTGNSMFLETMIRQDIEFGRSVALFDPHGDLVERLATFVQEKRKDDLIYFNVPDASLPLSFDRLESVAIAEQAVAASGIIKVFKKSWVESWGPRLRNALLALPDPPLATLADILRMLDEPAFRRIAASKVGNSQVRRFWLQEYEGYPARFCAEAIAPIQNKVGAFLGSPVTQNRPLMVT